MFIVWYAMNGLSGYGMRFNYREEADIFMNWMSQFPTIYSDISLEER